MDYFTTPSLFVLWPQIPLYSQSFLQVPFSSTSVCTSPGPSFPQVEDPGGERVSETHLDHPLHTTLLLLLFVRGTRFLRLISRPYRRGEGRRHRNLVSDRTGTRFHRSWSTPTTSLIHPHSINVVTVSSDLRPQILGRRGSWDVIPSSALLALLPGTPGRSPLGSLSFGR